MLVLERLANDDVKEFTEYYINKLRLKDTHSESRIIYTDTDSYVLEITFEY